MSFLAARVREEIRVKESMQCVLTSARLLVTADVAVAGVSRCMHKGVTQL